MPTVIFQTDDAIFNFDYDAVKNHLEQRISDHNLPENHRQLDLLLNSRQDSIEINPDEASFGYISLELIDSGTGQVTCKKCDQKYSSSELIPFEIGAGKNPLKPNIEIKWSLRNLLRRRKRNPSMTGGYGYKCPAGHELIAMVTWRT